MSCAVHTDTIPEDKIQAMSYGIQSAWQEVREYFHCDRKCHGIPDWTCKDVIECVDINMGRLKVKFPESEKIYQHDYGSLLPTPEEQLEEAK